MTFENTVKIRNTEVTFVDKSSLPGDIEVAIIEAIIKTLKNLSQLDEFQKLEIHLENNVNYKKTPPSSSNAAEYLTEIVTSYINKEVEIAKMAGKCIFREFQEQKRNIIHLFIDTIFIHANITEIVLPKQPNSKEEKNRVYSLFVNKKERLVQNAIKITVATLDHEFIHLLQFKKQKYAEIRIRYQNLANKNIKEMKKRGKGNRASTAAEYKRKLTIFSGLIPLEGLATYCEDNEKKDFNKLYRNAKDKILGIKIQLDRIVKYITEDNMLMALSLIDTVEHDITSASYDIGHHIVDTIIRGWIELGVSANVDKLELLLQQKRREFYREYESICEDFGIQPVFTFDSKKGIFDYKTYADKLSALIPKTEEKQKTIFSGVWDFLTKRKK